MIRGRFWDTSGRPFIDGRLIIKKLKVISFISFCLDTGSDETVLLPIDSRRIALDFSKLTEKTSSCALSGNCELYAIPAIVQFFESDYIYSYEILLKIAPINPDIMQLPSILGRNIFDHWSISYCRNKNRLNIKVLSADHVRKVILTP